MTRTVPPQSLGKDTLSRIDLGGAPTSAKRYDADTAFNLDENTIGFALDLTIAQGSFLKIS